MRVDFCFLADAVAAPPDGKFYVQGGGISRISAPTFPFAVPQVAIVVRLLFDESEVNEQHAYTFTFINGEGVAIAPPLHFVNPPPETPPPALADGEDRFAVIAANVNGLTFVMPGPHRLEFRADGELMATTSLAVVAGQPASSSGPPPPSGI
jgi:hypothetical protein